MTATITKANVTAVTRGAEFLDARRPGWVDEIDVDTLDLCSLDDCILGQLYGDWGAAQEAIEEIRWDSPAQVSYGFETTPPHSREKYAALTEAWRVEILRRREGEDDD